MFMSPIRLIAHSPYTFSNYNCAQYRSSPSTLLPSLIEGLRVVQGVRVVPVFLYRYSMKKYSEKGS